jgi:hypothetical protein
MPLVSVLPSCCRYGCQPYAPSFLRLGEGYELSPQRRFLMLDREGQNLHSLLRFFSTFNYVGSPLIAAGDESSMNHR